MSITVYTVIVGLHDYLRPPIVVEPGVRYVCFTDIPRRCEPWEIQPAPKLTESDARDARLPKILFNHFVESEWSIYHDAHLRLKVRASELVRAANDQEWAMFLHPARSCLYQEAAVCLKEEIGTAALITAQVERAKQSAVPVDAGLWCGGTIVRKNTPQTRELADVWWREFFRGCERDQIAFPIARWLLGTEVGELAGSPYGSEYVGMEWHAAWKDKGDNPNFAPWRAAQECRLTALERACTPISDSMACSA